MPGTLRYGGRIPWLLLASLGLMLLSLLANTTSRPVSAAEPAITVTPDPVSCEASLTIRGANFIPGLDVIVSTGGPEDIPGSVFEGYWGPVPVGDDGTFTIEGVKPILNECVGLPAEPHYLTASTATGASNDGAFGPPTATASFDVDPQPDDPRLVLTPDHGFGCIDVTAYGENFEPGTIVTLSMNEFPPDHVVVSLGEVEVANDGTFTFTLPRAETTFIRCDDGPPPIDGQRYIVGASTGQLRVGDGLREPSAAYIFTETLPPADRFQQTWARTDLPVLNDEVSRTWIWGPEPISDVMEEAYAESPGGTRSVRYYDKSRMEITYPDGDRGNPWYVTNGLLVVEMVEGKYQVGDATFDETPDPAEIPIAGDADSTSPTYAEINQLGLTNRPARAVGTVIDEYIYTSQAEVGVDDAYAAYGVTAAYTVSETNHTVASIFWEFMNAEGLIYHVPSDRYIEADLFEDPFYATGFPITEAYWTTTLLQGAPADILWQCFERRCLTYTPDNPADWQIEAGNVGRHYHEWRYGSLLDEVRIIDTGVAQSQLVGVDDTHVVWESDDIYGAEIENPEPFVIADELVHSFTQAFDAGVVIWDEANPNCDTGCSTIYSKRIESDDAFVIAPGGQLNGSEVVESYEAISYPWVVWLRFTGRQSELLARNIETMSEPITLAGPSDVPLEPPVIDGERVVWMEEPNELDPNVPNRLVTKHIGDDDVTLIAEGVEPLSYAVGGDLIVYADVVTDTLFAYRISTGEVETVFDPQSDTDARPRTPVTDGRYVFWVQGEPTPSGQRAEQRIRGYDVETGSIFDVAGPGVMTPGAELALDDGQLAWLYHDLDGTDTIHVASVQSITPD